MVCPKWYGWAAHHVRAIVKCIRVVTCCDSAAAGTSGDGVLTPNCRGPSDCGCLAGELTGELFGSVGFFLHLKERYDCSATMVVYYRLLNYSTTVSNLYVPFEHWRAIEWLQFRSMLHPIHQEEPWRKGTAGTAMSIRSSVATSPPTNQPQHLRCEGPNHRNTY